MKYVLLLLLIGFYSCADKKPDNVSKQTNDSLPKDSLYWNQISLNYNDTTAVLFLPHLLYPIRENFKRLNSVAKWTRIETRELAESTEGGEAKFYYMGDSLLKIVAKYYGETYQQLAEYYLSNNQLSFVLEKQYKYNRPMYYDSAALKENNDTETFDFDKSTVIEKRTFFHNETLIHQINNEGGEVPFYEKYLKEENTRIKASFNKLLTLATKK